MKAYRILWLVACVPLAMVGMGVAAVLSPAAFACLFIAFAAVGIILTRCVVNDHEKRPPPVRRRLVAVGALLGGTTAGAFAGLVFLLDGWGFLLSLLVLVSSPYTVGTFSRWLIPAPKPSAAQLDALAPPFAYASPEYMPFQLRSELGELTDEQLCRGWRASYVALQQPSSPVLVIAIVDERRKYLDELERRNANGFAAWLASGARAAGNPLPYLIGSRVDHPTINWDELTRGQDW